MDRRNFLRTVGLTGVGLVLSPFIAPDPGWAFLPLRTGLYEVSGAGFQPAWVVIMHPAVYAEHEQLLAEEGLL